MSEQSMKQAQELLSQHKFFLLGKSWCPDVQYAIRTLEKYDKYKYFYTYHLDKLPEKESLDIEAAFALLAGRKWVPAIFVGGKYWGNEETLKKLEGCGTLEKELEALIR